MGHASWISSVINLLNTIVGAGVLAMPLAMSHTGIVLGTMVIIWAGLTAGFGLYLQTRCARYLDRGSASFFALSQITYPSAAVIFDAAIATKCFGVGVSYLIIIGDLMPGVVRGFSDETGVVPFLVDRHFWITAFMLVVIPLSFLRRLDSLKYTSIIALISIGYLVVLVIYHFAAHDTYERGQRTPVRVLTWAGPIAALSSFPVIVFAYTCHQNMFSILNEIANASHVRTSSVVFASVGSAAAIYILVAITGYLSFGNDISGNIVAQYVPSVSATVGRAAIVVLVMFSYPLQVHPCRASVNAVLKWRPKSLQSATSSKPGSVLEISPPRNMAFVQAGKLPSASSISQKDDMGDTRFAIITTAVIILSYVVAMTVSSLEDVLAYVGSTGSTSISFILPGSFYYKISAPDSTLHQQLLKQEDDFDADEEEAAEEEEEEETPSATEEGNGDTHNASGTRGEDAGLLGRGARHRRWTGGGSPGPTRWRRKWLRRSSLALAVYGLLVMVVCLVTKTFFLVAS